MSDAAPIRPVRRQPAQGIVTSTGSVRIPPNQPYRFADNMLIVGSPRGRATTPVDEYLDRYDAEHEDEAGRLPHEPGYGEPATVHRLPQQNGDRRDRRAA